jgi:hypothetical protein
LDWGREMKFSFCIGNWWRFVRDVLNSRITVGIFVPVEAYALDGPERLRKVYFRETFVCSWLDGRKLFRFGIMTNRRTEASKAAETAA